MPTYTAATNPAYLDGYPQGWSVQNVEGLGGGNESLVSGGSAPLYGVGGGGAAMNSLTAHTFSPELAIAGTVGLATGAQYASKFFWPGGNMNYLWTWVSTIATTSTHGWFAVYDGSGNLWAATADQTSTYLTVAGAQKVAVASAPVPVPSGWYYGYAAGVMTTATAKLLGLFSGIGTPTGLGIEIGGLVAGTWNFAANATTVSALPASLTWGTNWAADGGSTGVAMWFGVS